MDAALNLDDLTRQKDCYPRWHRSFSWVGGFFWERGRPWSWKRKIGRARIREWGRQIIHGLCSTLLRSSQACAIPWTCEMALPRISGAGSS